MGNLKVSFKIVNLYILYFDISTFENLTYRCLVYVWNDPVHRLFIKAKIGNYPLIRLKNYIRLMEYYAAIKKEEALHISVLIWKNAQDIKKDQDAKQCI